MQFRSVTEKGYKWLNNGRAQGLVHRLVFDRGYDIVKKNLHDSQGMPTATHPVGMHAWKSFENIMWYCASDSIKAHYRGEWVITKRNHRIYLYVTSLEWLVEAKLADKLCGSLLMVTEVHSLQ